MSEQDGLDPAERELEFALQSLAPAPVRIDPVAAAFQAGHQSARRQLFAWQSATVGLLLAGIALWVASFEPSAVTQTPIRSPNNVVRRDPTPPQWQAPQSVVMLQTAMQDEGLEGLPPTHLPRVGPIRTEEILMKLRGET